MDNQDANDSKFISMKYVEDAAGSTSDLPAPTVDENAYSKEVDSRIAEDEHRVSKLVRKVDTRLVLILALLYITSFLDRSNLGNVRCGNFVHMTELTALLGLHCWYERRSRSDCWRSLLDRHLYRKITPL